MPKDMTPDAGTKTANAANPAGKITEIAGDAFILHADGTRIPAAVNAPVFQGDIIETSKTGAVNIQFADNTTFAVSENARMSVDQFTYDTAQHTGTSFFSMVQGVFVYTSGLIGKGDPGNVSIETPVGSIGIRGTVVAGDISSSGEDSKITILDGAIAFTNGAGTHEMNKGFDTISLKGYNDAPDLGHIDAKSFNDTYHSVSSVAGDTFDHFNRAAQNNDSRDNGQHKGQQNGEGGDNAEGPKGDAPQHEGEGPHEEGQQHDKGAMPPPSHEGPMMMGPDGQMMVPPPNEGMLHEGPMIGPNGQMMMPPPGMEGPMMGTTAMPYMPGMEGGPMMGTAMPYMPGMDDPAMMGTAMPYMPGMNDPMMMGTAMPYMPGMDGSMMGTAMPYMPGSMMGPMPSYMDGYMTGYMPGMPYTDSYMYTNPMYMDPYMNTYMDPYMYTYIDPAIINTTNTNTYSVHFQFAPIYLQGTAVTWDDGLALYGSNAHALLNVWNGTPIAVGQVVNLPADAVVTMTGNFGGTTIILNGGTSGGTNNINDFDTMTTWNPTVFSYNSGTHELMLNDPWAMLGDLNGGSYNFTVSVSSNGSTYYQGFTVFIKDWFNGPIYEGTGGVDTIIGTAATELIFGGAGNDVIVSYGGADVLMGGAGDDSINIINESFYLVNGGAGNDTLILGGPGGINFGGTSGGGKVVGIEKALFGVANNTLSLNIRDIFESTDPIGHHMTIEAGSAVSGSVFNLNTYGFGAPSAVPFAVGGSTVQSVTYTGTYNGSLVTLVINTNNGDGSASGDITVNAALGVAV